ncbi:MAG: DUF924 family protein [Pseudomonadota bacterium]
MTAADSSDDDARIERVLDLWFPKKSYDAPQIDARMDLWFGEDAERDTRLRYEFVDMIQEASEERLNHWATAPRGRLALIILLDQFRRNIYRGTKKAFSHDKKALRLAVEGIVEGLDKQLNPLERVFFYMPLQHAESARVQRKSVQVFRRLAQSVSETLTETFDTFAQFAELHCDIIEQFGRFPHRNKVLGRDNTPEEEVYLNGDAQSFGQG